MSLAHYGDTAFVKDPVTGEIKPAAGATITVYQWGTTTPISLLKSDGTLLANPFTSDPQTGRYDLYTSVGQRVTVQVALTGYTTQQITAEVEPDPALGGTGAHTHPESDVVNLGTDLSAKAPLAAPDFPTYVDYSDQAGNPANPATGIHRLFAKAGGLYAVDPVGSVLGPLGAAGPPSGAAGGDLTGFYPNPPLANKNAASGPLILDANALPLAANFGTGGLMRTFESFGGTPGGSVSAQAAAVAAAYTWMRGTPGGQIIFTAATYINLPQIVLPNRCRIECAGMMGTTLQEKASLNTDFIVNEQAAQSVNGTTYAKFCAVRNACIDGNKANQTSGRAIFWSSPNPGAPGATDDDPDSHQLVENVRIRNVKGDGWSNSGASENRWVNVYHDYVDGNAMVPGYDSWILACTSSASGLAGFLSTSPSLRVSALKCFYSGNVTASSGVGCNYNSQRGGGVNISCTEMQDNKAYGYQINTASNVNLSGTADSNGTSSAGTYTAIDLWDARHNTINIVCLDRQWNGVTNTQLNAIQIRTNSKYNSIRLTHFAAAGTVNDPVQNWDAGSTPNDVSINGSAGQQQVSVATGTLTPVPTNGGCTVNSAGLTGALTVADAAVGQKWPGQRIRFHIGQDGIGGHAITWNAAYHLAGAVALPTTASKRNIIDFEWDATAALWAETGRSTGI